MTDNESMTNTNQTARRRRCPHCGNTDTNLMQSNLGREHGVTSRHPDLTILCVARVPPDASSFAPLFTPSVGADGMVECGMQWDPNQ